MLSSILRSVLVVGLTAAGVLAQQEESHLVTGQAVTRMLTPSRVAKDTPGSLAGPTGVISRAAGLSERDGVLLGVGPDYEIRFEDGAIEFTPLLGSAVSRAMPLRFALESIRRGETILLTGDGTAVPQRRDQSVLYRHPGGVVERYDVLPEGVEQSFVFPDRLPGRGDVVVRGRITTELGEQAAGHGDGPRFLLDGVGGVEFGAVTGIGADGRRHAGSIRCRDDLLELTLPHDFVESARYPMVLDPRIGTVRNAASGGDDVEPDVAYDLSNDVYLVVWRRTIGGTNTSIYGQLVDGTRGTLIGVPIQMSGTARVNRLNPTVANVNLTDRFLVAWQEGASPVGPWDILAVCVDARTGAVSPEVVVAGGPSSEVHPDAASDPTGADDEAILVWEETGSGIFGAQITCGSTGPIPFSPVVISSNPNDGRPAVSKSASLEYLVVWERQQFTSLAVFAKAISRNLSVGTAEVSIANVSNIDEARPDVDGDGNEFVVAYQVQEGIGSAGSDIACRRVDVSGLSATVQGPITLVASDAGVDQREPAIGLLGPKYAVAWMRQSNGLNYDIELLGISPDDCSDCGLLISEIGIVTNYVHDGYPEIASKVSGGSTSDDCLVAFSDATITTLDSDILAFGYEALGPGGPVVEKTGGCGAPTTIGTSGGAFASGNSSFAITMSGAESGVTTAILAIGARDNTFACGSCEILLPVISLALPVVNGNASLSIPVSCDPIFLGGFFEMQWWPIGTSQTPCVFLPSASLTNRLDVTVGL